MCAFLWVYIVMESCLRYYKATFIMRSCDPATLRITDIWHFRSKKSNKLYIVEVEHFSRYFLGLKFYWKGVSESKNRYSLLTHDYEPRSIIMSCVHIMLDYFRRDRCSSFGFVAADNDVESDGRIVVNKRFRFYRRMMLSLFSPESFVQAYDVNNSVYVLINAYMLANGKITVNIVEDELALLYCGDYTLNVSN